MSKKKPSAGTPGRTKNRNKMQIHLTEFLDLSDIQNLFLSLQAFEDSHNQEVGLVALINVIDSFDGILPQC